MLLGGKCCSEENLLWEGDVALGGNVALGAELLWGILLWGEVARGVNLLWGSAPRRSCSGEIKDGKKIRRNSEYRILGRDKKNAKDRT
ncbi:MAG: hypothetical protein KBC30_06195 [Planctomycetes bacterium]|nr:hypothetical protein [Planctomycetota bacterium]HPY74567.1 hypothetical protein [Planctomycetota bacterium]HQB01565.1 hypothetical protein [Planctomycetota bacterium]